jgi:hypothetical protein
MVFLVSKENKLIVKVETPEEAKNFVSYYKDKGVNFEIIGACNRQKFNLLYPEYKDYDFVDNDGFKTN